jgi:hypothetical protein
MLGEQEVAVEEGKRTTQGRQVIKAVHTRVVNNGVTEASFSRSRPLISAVLTGVLAQLVEGESIGDMNASEKVAFPDQTNGE